MGIEFEVKFRATGEQLAAIRAACKEGCQTIAMETTYYDTPDGALAQRWFTLRRRRENDRWVCTLKTPEKGLGRGEYEVLCPDIRQAIPELCKLSNIAELPSLIQPGLVEVCGATFTRQAFLLCQEDCTVELALDSGTLSGGGQTVPLCEVEVELKAGSREAVLAFSQALAARFGLVPETKSKFRRALALAKGE